MTYPVYELEAIENDDFREYVKYLKNYLTYMISEDCYGLSVKK